MQSYIPMTSISMSLREYLILLLYYQHIQEMTKGMGVKFDKEIKLFKLGENRSQQLREIE